MNVAPLAALLLLHATAGAPADTVATRSARADSASAAAAAEPVQNTTKESVTDSVTVLPPVKVEGDRVAEEGRRTATKVRLSRGQLLRFLPSTTGEALLGAPGVDLARSGAW